MLKKRRTYDVFVGNLPLHASERLLSPMFTELGEVHAISIKNGRKHDRIAFVQYLCEPDADMAVQRLNGQYFEGCQLSVSRSRRSEGIPAGQGQQSAPLGAYPSNDAAKDAPYLPAGRSGNQRAPVAASFHAQHSAPCSDESLVVCHVKDVTSFYGQRVVDVVRVNKLNSDLEQFCMSAPRLCSETPDFQKMYASQYSDDKAWYRCKVLKQLDNGQSFVQYVDFGNCEAVKSSEMVPLKGELASLEPLALCCRLDGLFGIRKDEDSFFYTQAMREISDLLQEQCVSVQMKRATASGIHFLVRCRLEQSGLDLGDELIRRGYAKVVCPQMGMPMPNGAGMMAAPRGPPPSARAGRPTGWYPAGPPWLGHPTWNPRPHYEVDRQELLSYLELASTSAKVVKAGGHQSHQSGDEPRQRGPKKGATAAQHHFQQAKQKEVPQVRVLKPEKYARQQEDQAGAKQTTSTTKEAAAERDKLNKLIKLQDNKIKLLEKQLDEQQKSKADGDFLSRVSKVLKLVESAREQRDQLSVNPSEADAVQRAMTAYAACKEAARAILNSSEVEDGLERYRRAQDSIQLCKDKEMVAPLVEERNSAQKCLQKSLTSFLSKADCLAPQGDLGSCTASLGSDSTAAMALGQEALEDLDRTLMPFIEGTVISSDGPGPSLEQVHELFQQIKKSLEADFSARRTLTDAAEGHLSGCLHALLEALHVSGKKPHKKFTYSPAFLEACLSNFQHSLAEEVAACSLVQPGSSLHVSLCLLSRMLRSELSDMLERISDVTRQRARYVELLESLTPLSQPRTTVGEGAECTDTTWDWASVEDLVKTLKEKRQTVRQLKSQLRHSLADMEDVDSRESPEWKDAVEAVQNLREQVLDAFVEEDTLLGRVMTLQEKHFPELALLFPELETDACLRYKGLVKSSWELCVFQRTEDVPSFGGCFKSSYSGVQVVIKEFVVETEELKQEFLTKAAEWSQLLSLHLVPLKAAFVSKDGHKVYLMSPWQQCSTLASCESPSKELGRRVLEDALGGLATLHSAGAVHGGVHPVSILVPPTAEANVLLDVPNFVAHLCKDETIRRPLLNGIDTRAPELSVAGAVPTPEADMYALGCTLLWLCFPKHRFQLTAQGVPNFSGLQKPQMEEEIFSLCKNLLKSDPKVRPKATQVLSTLKVFQACAKQSSEERLVRGDDPKILTPASPTANRDSGEGVDGATSLAARSVGSECSIVEECDIAAASSTFESSAEKGPDVEENTSEGAEQEQGLPVDSDVAVPEMNDLENSEAPPPAEGSGDDSTHHDVPQSPDLTDVSSEQKDKCEVADGYDCPLATATTSTRGTSDEQPISVKAVDIVEPFVDAMVSETFHSVDLGLDVVKQVENFDLVDESCVHLGGSSSTAMGAPLLQNAPGGESSNSEDDDSPDYITCSTTTPRPRSRLVVNFEGLKTEGREKAGDN